MPPRRKIVPAGVLCLVLMGAKLAHAEPEMGFAVPPGFEVSLYADDALATDIFSLTIDAQGRVVVAGKGYVKVLHDTDGDGRADKATLFSDLPRSGAHGMYFDGNDLICSGDNGVRRYSDVDGDGRCDRVSDAWLPTKNDGEHAANGIVRGPDGWYYMICGNDAGIGRAHVRTARSPVREPIAGTVVRFTDGGKQSEVYADGFRNPYDLAFNHLGQIFTVDSDGERVHHLPYYTPNRLYDIAQGMNHGWILPGWQRGWARPECWPDNVDRLVEVGRGSPTGVVVYRHRAFPERYRNGVFSLCWTFGRVYFAPLQASGATYRSKMEVFMRTTGDIGFAPTDLAVGPDGDLFIAIGGRGTRGGVFRVRYRGAEEKVSAPKTLLRAVLSADEPLSSWSRARWLPAAQQLGALAFAGAVANEGLPLAERIRAVEVHTELYGGIPLEMAQQVAAGPAELVARVAWSLGRGNPSDDAIELLSKLTTHAHAHVARAAWEALAAGPPLSVTQARLLPVQAGLGHAERRIRAAAVQTARHSPSLASRIALAQAFRDAALREQLAYYWLEPNAPALYQQRRLDACLEAIASAEPALRLEGVRLLQIALGDVVVAEGADKSALGYAAQDLERIDRTLRRPLAQRLAELFPTPQADVDRELARLLALLGEDLPGLPERVSTRWTARSSAEDDIHYLLVLARLPGVRSNELTQRTAAALNGIYTKLAARGARPTDQVPAVLEAMCDRLLERDPALADAIVADAAFGVPGHELYANRLPTAQRQAAARKLLSRLGRLDEEQRRAAWGPDLVQLVNVLPADEALPILRREFADPRLVDSIAPILAERRDSADRPHLTAALASAQPRVAASAAEALRHLAATPAGAAEVAAAVKALRRFGTDKTARAPLVKLLTQWSGGSHSSTDPAAWTAWFTHNYPSEAPGLLGMTGAGSAAWRQRLAKVDWDRGAVKSGELVFQRRSCHRCHGDARRLGPDLAGAADRFARDDLFVAILEPSQDIAPAYVPTMITTSAGKQYSGMLIYQSPELTLLQTAPDTTARIPGPEVLQTQPGRISFMPAGLLDDATDQDLADLYAYLKTLRKK